MISKKEIISVVKDMENKLGESKFELFSDKVTSNSQKEKKIGNNQFRELAAICRAAECYEEIEMLVQYNIAKSDGVSWAKMCGGRKFGDIVIDKMQELKKKDEQDIMKILELFFGYLYWQARIWTSENKVSKEKHNALR